MAWVMEVKNENGWESVHPFFITLPYMYNSREEALEILNMFFPDCVYGEDVRVSEILDE